MKIKKKKQNCIREFICQVFHECYVLEGGCWKTEKTVETKEEAIAWVKEGPPYEDRRYYEVRTPLLQIIKEQLRCIQSNKKCSLPKDILIDSYQELIKMVSNDWRIFDTIENAPNQHVPLLLLIRKNSGRLTLKTAIYDDWCQDLFIKNDVMAWKYIELPSFVENQDFNRSYPVGIVLNNVTPGCELDLD